MIDCSELTNKELQLVHKIHQNFIDKSDADIFEITVNTVEYDESVRINEAIFQEIQRRKPK